MLKASTFEEDFKPVCHVVWARCLPQNCTRFLNLKASQRLEHQSALIASMFQLYWVFLLSSRFLSHTVVLIHNRGATTELHFSRKKNQKLKSEESH